VGTFSVLDLWVKTLDVGLGGGGAQHRYPLGGVIRGALVLLGLAPVSLVAS
jgi:hypothetical protein